MYVDNTNAIRKGPQETVPVTGVEVYRIRKQLEKEEEERRFKQVLTVVFIVVAIVATVLLTKYVIPKIISGFLKLPPIGVVEDVSNMPPTINAPTIAERVSEGAAPVLSKTVETVSRAPIGVKPNLPPLPAAVEAIKGVEPMHNFTVTSAVGVELTPISNSSSVWSTVKAPAAKPSTFVNVVLPILSTIGTILLAL